MGNITCVPTGFTPSVAVELGNLVLAAYDQLKPPARRGTRWPLTPPYQLVAPFSASPPGHSQETFGFVAKRTDTGDAYVAFRGTQTFGDWLANVDFLQVAGPNGWGKTEKGFTAVYDGAAPAIRAALAQTGNPPRVFVTGHSLGGALATLCAADLRGTLGATTTLYAFASPRAGDPAFADRFNSECPDTYRIVNTEDVVNTVPLAATAVLDGGAVMQAQLSSLERILQGLQRIPGLNQRVKEFVGLSRSILAGQNFEHVGTPVDFTQHNQNIVDNHEMPTYLTAVGGTV